MMDTYTDAQVLDWMQHCYELSAAYFYKRNGHTPAKHLFEQGIITPWGMMLLKREVETMRTVLDVVYGNKAGLNQIETVWYQFMQAYALAQLDRRQDRNEERFKARMGLLREGRDEALTMLGWFEV